MKKTLIVFMFTLSLTCWPVVFAQEPKKSEPADDKSTEGAAAAAAKPKAVQPSQEELEASFKTLLTKATLSGRWSPINNAQLGAEKKDNKYSIVSATKISGDQWVIRARMHYGQNEMVVPVPVQVKWSGDTPVIIVNNFSVGGNQSYTARVLFFEDSYAGSWMGSGGYGGLLYGSITHETDSAPKPNEPKTDGQK
jgi:hypothetical protein